MTKVSPAAPLKANDVRWRYAIALGSNRRGRQGSPEQVVRAALAALDPVATSAILSTPALGPSSRRFANAVAIIDSGLSPDALLDRLKRIERDFGRRPGQRWGARVIDLDIVLWSGGSWAAAGLVVPHAAFRVRDFVLRPLAAVTPEWRDPVTGYSVRQLYARLTRRRPVA